MSIGKSSKPRTWETPPKYEPTPEEIEAVTAQIRAGWDKFTLRKRARYVEPPVEVAKAIDPHINYHRRIVSD